MRYALLIHYPQPAVPTVSQDEIKAGMAAFQAYAKALEDAGVLQSAEVLQTIANATSVSVKQGKLQVQDGPFAETKEAFAGIFVLDVPDLDAALAWAERCPAAHWGDGGDPPLGGALRRRRVDRRALSETDAAARAEELARAAYGRLLAMLAARDARHRGGGGLPRRRLRAGAAHVARDRRAGQSGGLAAHRRPEPPATTSGGRPPSGCTGPLDEPCAATPSLWLTELDPDAIPDRRLALLFVCAHPAIDPASARRSCSRRCSASTRSRSRARSWSPARRWRSGWCGQSAASAMRGIPFAVPDREQMPARLGPPCSRRSTARTRSTSRSSPASRHGSRSPRSRTISRLRSRSCCRTSRRRWDSPGSISLSLARRPARAKRAASS